MMGPIAFWRRNGTDCREVRSLLSAYMDGQVADSERTRFEAHLAICAACQKELASLRATVALLRQLPPLRVPRSFAIAVPERRVASGDLFLYLRGAAAAVAALLIVMVGASIYFEMLGGQLRIQRLPPPTPVAVEKQVVVTAVVEKLVDMEKVVEKPVVVEKKVVETVVVEKPVERKVTVVVEKQVAVEKSAEVGGAVATPEGGAAALVPEKALARETVAAVRPTEAPAPQEPGVTPSPPLAASAPKPYASPAVADLKLAEGLAPEPSPAPIPTLAAVPAAEGRLAVQEPLWYAVLALTVILIALVAATILVWRRERVAR